MPDTQKVVAGMLKGIPASEGIAIGRAWILSSPWDEIRELTLEKGQIDEEIHRYRNAVNQVGLQLNACRRRVAKEIGPEEAKIFDAHLAILNDPFFKEEIPETLRNRNRNAEAVLKSGIQRFGETFNQMENDYFKQRIDDIQDVAVRLLRVLLSRDEFGFSTPEEAVLIAHTLTPSDTARIDPEKILGFATELGGVTSHASILARSKNIPAVVGVEHLMDVSKQGNRIIIDGITGIVYVDPPEDLVSEYRKQQAKFAKYLKKLSGDISLEARTMDGVSVSLYANVSMMADVSLSLRYRAEGIGLFRTELSFLIAGDMLDEESQFNIYRTVVEAMQGKPVTIRTLDLGGDKFLPFESLHKEKNPFMGWRSIRIFLQEKDVFRTQIRAILRASHYGPVRILYPMISSYEEIREIATVMESSKEELRRIGIPFDENVPGGIMVEVPSAAICAEQLIRFCDFFSIGTNDLIQYTLAVDRNNEKVARFYQPTNPAVLKLIHQTIRAANEAGKPVSICGEMAGNPLFTPLFLGMGLRHFSMSPSLIPEVKERLRAVSVSESETLVREVLAMASSEEIDTLLDAFGREANRRQTVPFLENLDD
ncbi:MAG TPA: phosphoenolpyruvate--protein phosphotransferase [bacterium]|nr:phosphoenolpyruvate--protein phosphotransferase [bacterium]